MIRLFKKDILLFIQDKRSLLMSLLLPIVLIALFGFILKGNTDDGNSLSPIKLLVCDEDVSEISKALISVLDSSENLEVIQFDCAQSLDLINRGKYVGVLIFHDGFQDSIELNLPLPLEIKYDRAHELELRLLQSLITKSLLDTIGSKILSGHVKSNVESMYGKVGPEMLRLIDQLNASINLDDLIVLRTSSIVGEKKKISLNLIQAIAGTAVIMLLFSITTHATSIISEKENGTMNRLLCSPLNPTNILFGKMLSAFFIAICQLSVMILFSIGVFNFDITVNFPAFILLVFATIIAVTGFGFFLAAISNTRQQAENLSTLVIIVMSAIGGSMVPLFMMPEIMEKFALFTVNYWVIQSFYDIYWRLLPFSEILPRIFVLLFAGFAMIIISIALFRRNINRIVLT